LHGIVSAVLSVVTVNFIKMANYVHPFLTPLSFSTLKAVVIVWRLRGNIIRIVLYCQPFHLTITGVPAVLMATSHSYGNGQNSTLTKSKPLSRLR